MMYSQQYDSRQIRNGEYSVIHYIAQFLYTDDSVLDFGCGTCKKTILLAGMTKNVVGIDHNKEMIMRAEENIASCKCKNIEVLEADNMASPFQKAQFSLCTAFLTTYSPSEAHRLLETNGRFIIEIIDADDKEQFKLQFGTDQIGWRGRFLNQTCEERRQYILASLSPFFEIEKIIPVEFETTLSISGAIKLLQETPTIRDFNPEIETARLTRLAENGMVSFLEKRSIIIARKIDMINATS